MVENRQLRKATSITISVCAAVETNLTMSEYARKQGLTKGYVSRLFTRAARQGYIQREYRTAHVVWKLTQEGQKILELSRTGNDKATSAIQEVYKFRWEHLLLKSEWVKLPKYWEAKLATHGFVYNSSFPRGGGSWENRVGDATVLVTRKSVMFLVRPVVGESVTECVERGLGVVLGVRKELEREFGGVLSFPERLSVRRQEVALIGGMTKSWPKWFGMTDRVKIDNSHGQPEIETVHAGLAVEDMNRILEFQDAVARGVITVESAGGSRQLETKARDWRDLV